MSLALVYHKLHFLSLYPVRIFERDLKSGNSSSLRFSKEAIYLSNSATGQYMVFVLAI